MDRKDGRYETIWNAEDGDHEEFLSETDVEQSVSHEKQWHSEEGRRSKWDQQPRGILYTIKKHRWIIDTSFMAIITGLLVLLLLRSPNAGSTRQIGGDFTVSNHECEQLISPRHSRLHCEPHCGVPQLSREL